MSFILNFGVFFSLLDTKTPQLKSGESSEKPRDASSCDLLHSTDRNYFEKLWARRSAQKSPVVRRGDRWGEAATEHHYTVSDKVER